MYLASPLRYPGGKSRLTDYIKTIIRMNNHNDDYYVEPFAGGASIGLSLLFQKCVSKIVINDLDRSIYSFWYSVLNNAEDLCRLIHDTPVTIENWRKYQEIQKKKDDYSPLDLGFSTFFLNRTNRSGIIMGGVIGGINQDGKWKINERFNKPNLIKRIEKIAQYRNRIQLYNLDGCKFVNIIYKKLYDKAFFYFDPPYYVKGKCLYKNHYNIHDHAILSEKIKSLDKIKWVVSYDNVPEIKDLYSHYRQVEYSLNYSAAKAKIGSEVMIFSHNLIIPDTSNPTKFRS